MSINLKRPTPRRLRVSHRMEDLRRAPRRETILTKGLQVARMGEMDELEETLRNMIPDEKPDAVNRGSDAGGPPSGDKRRPPHRGPKRIPDPVDERRKELSLLQSQSLDLEKWRTDLQTRLNELTGPKAKRIRIEDQNSGAIGGSAEPEERPRKTPRITTKNPRGIFELLGMRDEIDPNAPGTIHNMTVEQLRRNIQTLSDRLDSLTTRELEILQRLGLKD